MKKVIIIGCGFAGLTLARKLDKHLFTVTIVDKNNYHQFPPLLYQVAISGMEPNSICFPIRNVFAKSGVKFRMAEVISIDRENKCVHTTEGDLAYDYLVIATGTTTNYYGNEQIKANAFPMKSASDAITLRNKVLLNIEEATRVTDTLRKESLMRVLIVGGGATGVEIAGALSELKQYALPREFPELTGYPLHIYLAEGSDRLLRSMSEKSSEYALSSLQKMGVEVRLNQLVTGYDGTTALFGDGSSLRTSLLVWVSGVAGKRINGLPDDATGPGERILTDSYSRLECDENIFAIGDMSVIRKDGELHPDPQLAPVAIQQARTLAFNLKAWETGMPLRPFVYKNPGSMATIGRNKAVADLGKLHLNGIVAWLAWLIIHLRSILGVRNKIVILIDWIWNYFSYRHSIGLILWSEKKRKPK